MFTDEALPIAFSEVVSLPPKKETPEKEKTPVKPPSVQNPFEFPTLPPKSGKKGGKEEPQQESHPIYDYQDDYEHSDEHEPSGSSSNFEEDNFEGINLDDPIFKIVYPEIIEDPQFEAPKPNIKTLTSKLMFDVHIIVVRSPWEFWFQYADQSINILMHRMKEFYDEMPEYDLLIPDDNMKPGLIVAAKVSDTWHRARVISGPDRFDDVRLFFIDFGTSDAVHASNLRYLVKFFGEDPVKALRGSLAGVCPKNGEDSWTPTTRQVFFDSVANKKLFATIRSYREDDETYEVELSEKIANWPGIGEQMFRRGFADREEIKSNFQYAVPLSYVPRK